MAIRIYALPGHAERPRRERHPVCEHPRAGDPVECCVAYCRAGADELALLDITATIEGRATMLDVVKRVAEVCTVPFTVVEGSSTSLRQDAVLKAGANKVSTSSAAFRKPRSDQRYGQEFGRDRVTVAIDAAQRTRGLPSGYEVYIDGGRTATGKDAIEWAKACGRIRRRNDPSHQQNHGWCQDRI